MEQQAELKVMLTAMLEWLHNFCEEHHLRYYILGGTMLGAVRHKGFIPWDDDIDVGMPREDLEKLQKLLLNSKQERYILETYNTVAKDYYYPFAKLYDTQTTLIENTKYKIKRGVYIDIFPLDGIGNSLEESKKNYKKINILYDLLLSKVTGIRKGRSIYKNIVVIIFRMIPINAKNILQRLANECAKRKWDDYDWIGNLVGAWRFKEVMPKIIMGNPCLYQFENIMVYGAEKADEYLTYLYGDWRKLPPVEKRITHHYYIMCDLHKSYLDGDK